jgi:hypothetical protein
MDELGILPEDLEALVQVIEESFAIPYTARELYGAQTIGELAHCIYEKRKNPPSSECLSAFIFYQFRKAFMTKFGAPRAALKPETPLSSLLPWLSRRKRWRELQDSLQIRLPDLVYAPWVVGFSLVTTGLIVLAAWSRLREGVDLPFIVLCGGLFIWSTVLRLLAPFAREFPTSCETFGDLVRLALGRNYGKISSEKSGRTNEREILLVLRHLIAAETSTTLAALEPTTSLAPIEMQHRPA